MRFEAIIGVLSDSFYRSSLLILATSTLNALMGFVFWIVAARMYDSHEIGLAIGVISLMSLCVLFSRLGLEQSVIRFLPQKHSQGILPTSVLVTTVAAVLIAIVGWTIASRQLFTGTDSGNHQFLLLVLFVLFVSANSFVSTTGVAFIALRRSGLFLAQNMVTLTRVMFVLSLVFLGWLGIFSSVGLSLLLASGFSFLMLKRIGIRLSIIDPSFLRSSFMYSLGNYSFIVLSVLPEFVLPLIVIGQIGLTDAAIYYFAFAVSSVVLFIPRAFSVSLFVEGSHGVDLWKSFRKGLPAMYALIVPAVLVFALLGRYILSIYGEDYVPGNSLLNEMLLSALFYGIVFAFYSMKRVMNDTLQLVAVSGFNSAIVVVGGWFMVQRYGLIGAGHAWLVASVLTCIIASLLLLRDRGRDKASQCSVN